MKHYWEFMELLVWFRLSWRRVVVFLKLNLFIAKRDTLEKLKASDKARLRWCFSLMGNSSGANELLFCEKCNEKSGSGF